MYVCVCVHLALLKGNESQAGVVVDLKHGKCERKFLDDVDHTQIMLAMRALYEESRNRYRACRCKLVKYYKIKLFSTRIMIFYKKYLTVMTDYLLET